MSASGYGREAGPEWLAAWWPSARLRRDPLDALRVADRYAPVSVANWKLTPWMRKAILQRRVPLPLEFETGRRLSVIIPYRDRAEHLRELVPALRAHLDMERIAYRIVVVEQEMPGLFNRGRLINIGAAYAAEGSDYFCLHDVDAVPKVANYHCPSQPLRLVATIVTEHGRTTRPSYYFSGAISIRKEQLWRANGYSNEYWGWGKEDDDLFFRLLLAGYLCFFDTQGEFLDLPNPRAQQVTRAKFKKPAHLRRNRQRRSRLLRGLTDPMEDGLSTLRYEVTAQEARDGYEYVRVRW